MIFIKPPPPPASVPPMKGETSNLIGVASMHDLQPMKGEVSTIERMRQNEYLDLLNYRSNYASFAFAVV